MSDHGYQFQVVTGEGSVEAQAFEVFSYPMGDITVRRIPDTDLVAGAVQLLQINATVVDWTLVQQWATLTERLFPGQPRVLALPYLPSARGDKDVPSPAAVNATLAADSGITDIITIDPHSSVWLTTLRETNPMIREHTLPLGDIVRRALTADGTRPQHLGVISPDKGAVGRATEVATLLGLPVYVADKHRDPKTGHLNHYSLNADLAAGAYLVVDDIFDGGSTFALLADAVAEDVDLDLFVTHGGFTKPNHSADARAPYRRIYTTDSLPSAAAAGLVDNQIQVIALAPWIADVITPWATAGHVVGTTGAGQRR